MIERLGNAIYWTGLVGGIPTIFIWIAGGLKDIQVIGLPFSVLGWLIHHFFGLGSSRSKMTNRYGNPLTLPSQMVGR